MSLKSRGSVWTRLGWRLPARGPSASRPRGFRPRGFWSFRCKYSWGISTCRRRAHLCCQFNRRRLLMRRNLRKLTAGRTQFGVRQQRGGGSSSRGRGLDQRAVPTRRQLDAQLEEYMSLSKRRLDRELEEYMSMSRTRLDAQLDQYMSLAGETQLLWD